MLPLVTDLSEAGLTKHVRVGDTTAGSDARVAVGVFHGNVSFGDGGHKSGGYMLCTSADGSTLSNASESDTDHHCA